MRPFLSKITLFLLIASQSFLHAHEDDYVIDFPKVPISEMARFVSRVCEVNFIGDEALLDFDVSFYSGKGSTPEDLLSIMIYLIEHNGLEVKKQGDTYLVKERELGEDGKPLPLDRNKGNTLEQKGPGKYHLYKLQYHPGSEIMTAIKQMSTDMMATGTGSEAMLASISSLQWIESTNSLFFSGSENAITQMNTLIETLDIPIKQVFIEVLVVETSMANSLDFGVQWSASSKIKDRFGFGTGSFEPTEGSSFSFADTMKSIGDKTTPTGLSQFPTTRGFDLGIIGDIIFHKGKSFLSLGSLISMLQGEGDYSIVLNQKILAQENKSSTIFVGDNLPFAGSVVQTVGSSQQTTSNIEYRDVGVSLNITPLVGQSNIVTLKISEEITEAIDQAIHKSHGVSGIKTSKTNMATNAHVPNGHFLILSGMTRTVDAKAKTGPPCLGGIPFIGSLFSKKETKKDKSSILIFVKPTIIDSSDEYIAMSSALKAGKEL